MVLISMWNFVKRHKKKFIASGVVVGGAYCAYKFYLPRLQQRMLEEILGDAEGPMKEFLELARGVQGERAKKDEFERTQKVSDDQVKKVFEATRARLNKLFDVEACQERLKAASTKEEKTRCFQELQVESLARVVASAYTLHLLLLLQRVEVNLVSRNLASATQESTCSAFLESTCHAHGEGLQGIAHAIRTAVRSVGEAQQLMPATKVTAARLETYLQAVCSEADKELLDDDKASATLLPDSIDATGDVKVLLDQARDITDSPHFRETCRYVIADAMRRVVSVVSDDKGLADGRECPLAVLFGHLLKAEEKLSLSEDGCADAFAKKAIVADFCGSFN
jgi:peroxin-3